jgi:hypothetical protein
MIKLFSAVVVTTDAHEAAGVSQGMRGYVIEVYETGDYEVEFSDPTTGMTIAQHVLREADIVLAEPTPRSP